MESGTYTVRSNVPESPKGFLDVRIHGCQRSILTLKLGAGGQKVGQIIPYILYTARQNVGNSQVCRPRHVATLSQWIQGFDAVQPKSDTFNVV